MEFIQELVDGLSTPKSSKANFAIHSRMSDEQDMQNESDQPSLENVEDGQQALLQLAESFDPGQARRSVLHQYKRGVLLLRAKHATYEKIAAMLEKVGVKTSLFSVSRFCRQHRAELKKLRVQLESRKPPADAAEPLPVAGGIEFRGRFIVPTSPTSRGWTGQHLGQAVALFPRVSRRFSGGPASKRTDRGGASWA